MERCLHPFSSIEDIEQCAQRYLESLGGEFKGCLVEVLSPESDIHIIREVMEAPETLDIVIRITQKAMITNMKLVVSLSDSSP